MIWATYQHKAEADQARLNIKQVKTDWAVAALFPLDDHAEFCSLLKVLYFSNIT